MEFSPSVISVSRVGQGIVNISILTDALAKTGVPAGVVVESLLQKVCLELMLAAGLGI